MIQEAINPAHADDPRALTPARRSRCASLLLLLLCVYLSGCDPGADPELAQRQEEAWDPDGWTATLRHHLQRVEPMLPILTTAAQADAARLYQDTLRTVYAALTAAESTVPPIAWEAPLHLAEVHSKYGTALRELRYGAGLMLNGSAAPAEERLYEARYFLARGRRAFAEVRDRVARPHSGALPSPTHTTPGADTLAPAAGR